MGHAELVKLLDLGLEALEFHESVREGLVGALAVLSYGVGELRRCFGIFRELTALLVALRGGKSATCFIDRATYVLNLKVSSRRLLVEFIEPLAGAVVA